MTSARCSSTVARTSVTDPVTDQLRPISISARWGDEGEIVGYKAFRAEFDDWIGAIDERPRSAAVGPLGRAGRPYG